ncbi:MAG TPA: hypothetical protein VL443_23495 [Cyclobacteriaceae bacterium]|jgi:hypothetical protein|nr:hypothetical protein [Cyclobacteriaceae bacterium]
MQYSKLITLSFIVLMSSCKVIEDYKQSPELTPLEQGFKTCATIGYCASIASTAFNNETLPDNVTFAPSTKDGYTSSGLVHITVNSTTPLPFNSNIGDIYIAGLWDGTNGGVITIVFANIDIFTSTYKFYGLYTVPIIQDPDTKKLTTIFAQQDILIGQGSDTLLNLSLSKPKFDAELARANSAVPIDPFVAVKQNVWFVKVDQNNTLSNVYDDRYEINGGGQILEASSNSGGVLYHAMIETKFSSDCALNPTSGVAFIQNLKAATSSIDLGNITLNFHSTCDGKANVAVATGKYVASNGKNITLNWK